jgi:hypothetical protein
VERQPEQGRRLDLGRKARSGRLKQGNLISFVAGRHSVILITPYRPPVQNRHCSLDAFFVLSANPVYGRTPNTSLRTPLM